MKPLFKPNQLVWVKQPARCTNGVYIYIGEVMSLPFPSNPAAVGPDAAQDSIMVRRVPGHSGTLEQQPLDRLVPVLQKGFKFVEYCVVSAGRHSEFPVDMLRYDCCAPVNFRVEEKPQEGRTCVVMDKSFGTEEMMVAKACKTRSGAHWTDARWNSFMWRINRRAVLGISESDVGLLP